jgi:hypothetical protein
MKTQTPLTPVLVIAVLSAVLGGAGSAAADQQLYLGARVPLIIPVGLNTSVGVGVTPSLQLDVGRGVGLTFSSGLIYYSEEGRVEKDVPVLLGVAYTFREDQRIKPYLELKAGYTYVMSSDESSHWITATLGVGVYFRTVRNLEIDAGADFIVPDFRGNSRYPVGFMLKVGARYGLL